MTLEQIDDVKVDATSEGMPSTDDTPATASIDDLVAAVSESLRPAFESVHARLDGQQRQMDSRLVPIEQLKGSLELTRAQMQRLLKTQLTEDEYNAVQSEIQSELDQRQKDSELAALKRQAQENEKAQLTPAQKIEVEWQTYQKPLQRYASKQGVEWTDIEDSLPFTQKNGQNWPSWDHFLEAAYEVIDAEADKKHRDETPLPDLVQSRAAGGATTDEDLVTRLARGEALSPQDMLRAQKAFRDGVQPRRR